MSERHLIWWEILRPSWRWGVLVPLALLGSLATIRDDIINPGHPELFRLAHWLPRLEWQTYAIVGSAVFVFLILESAYRAIKWREDLIIEIASVEETISKLVLLQEEDRRCYFDTNYPAERYIENLKQWEDRASKLISDKYSASELHSFKSYSFFNGGEYMLPDEIAVEWRTATEDQRKRSTARIMALDKIIQYGSGEFLGPKMKLAAILESRR